MSKLIAVLAILAVSACLSVATMWYAYGVELKSVGALIGFAFLQAVTLGIIEAIKQER